MSLFSGILSGISKVLPIAAAIAPSSSRVTQALGTLSTVGKALSGDVSGVPGLVQSFVPKAAPRILSAAGAPMSTLPALPGVGSRVGTAIATVARSGAVQKFSRRAMQALNLYAIGSIVYDAATGQPVGQVGRRSMNPLNYRALKRATRRICAYQKINRKIERCMPKRKRC